MSLVMAGLLAAVPIAVLAPLEREFKKKGKLFLEWSKKQTASEKLLFQPASEKTDLRAMRSECFRVDIDQLGELLFRFEQTGPLWHIAVEWERTGKPFLSYTYDEDTKRIVGERLKKRYITGINGVMSVSQKDLDALCQHLVHLTSRHIFLWKQTTSAPIEEKKRPWYERAQWSTEGNRVTLTYGQMKELVWTALPERDSFVYYERGRLAYEGGRLVYRIEIERATQQITAFDIDEEDLHKIGEIQAFAVSERQVWAWMRAEKERRQQKKEDLRQAFMEPMKENETEEKRRAPEWADIRLRLCRLQDRADELSAENKRQVCEVLPKQLADTEALFRSTTADNQFFPSWSEEIDSVLSSIEHTLQHRGAERVKQVERVSQTE